jgi:branched-chain amino acid transport system ATP-binding protein
MLEVKNLNSGYGKKQVLFDVSFSIKSGEIALLIGSNGSGKSTLLKSIFSIVPKYEGIVCFNNQNITNYNTYELLQLGLLYVPQKNNFFENLSVVYLLLKKF